MLEDAPSLQAIRITPGTHASRCVPGRATTQQFNTKLWEKVSKLCDGIDITDLDRSSPANGLEDKPTEKPQPNVFWVTPDPRSTSVWGMLVEIFSPRPQGERTEEIIAQLINDLLISSYEITVVFPIQSTPSPAP